jgi:hypothetical protein
LVGAAVVLSTVPAAADQVILDDLIVDGSLCVGQDCVNGESFGFDTVRLKENNLRIRAVDTSSTASFPSNDWQITFNDSSNGGQNKFSIDDIDGGRTPFSIEASAPSHSLYVDDGGRIGLGTATPVVEVHIQDGDTPTLRLEQDGSSGFTPQTWDVAGNETNFFIRDASNGSTLPLRIRPGASTSSIDVHPDFEIGIGTASPSLDGRGIHVKTANSTSAATIGLGLTPAASGGNCALNLQYGPPEGQTFVTARACNGNEQIRFFVGATEQMRVDTTGVLVNGGTVGELPDYVFEDDYPLMPLDELASFITREKHLPEIPSAKDVESTGGLINISSFPQQLLLKIEELTLYTLDQQEQLEALRQENTQMKDALEELRQSRGAQF